LQPSRSRWQLVFFITALLHASGNLAYVLLGTSQEQKWTSADGDVNTPSVASENAPLVAADTASSSRSYGAVATDVVS